MNVPLTKESRIELHPLEHRIESDEEVLVGRSDISHFIMIPHVGWEVLELLRQGKTIDQIEEELSAAYHEPVEVLEFVQELVAEHPFIYRLDGQVLNEAVSSKEHFTWIPASLGRVLFHPVGWGIYALLLAFCLIVFVLDPQYVPSSSDFFASSSLTVNIIAALGISWLVLFVHELAHLTAAKSLGIGCRLGMGHRLVFPVAETDMSNIVLLPHRSRYRAYLAGLCSDTVFLSACMGIQLLTNAGWLELGSSALLTVRMISFHVMNLMLFQLLFFMKTDLYYVVTTYLRCERLMEQTMLFWQRRFGREAEWAEVPPRDKKLVYVYAWFYALGIGVTLVWFALIQVPVMYRFLGELVRAVSMAPLWSWSFAEGLLALGLVAFPVVVLIWSWTRSFRLRKGGEAHEG
jgi:putative peptide zinc metalloprotease protein